MISNLPSRLIELLKLFSSYNLNLTVDFTWSFQSNQIPDLFEERYIFRNVQCSWQVHNSA